MLLRGCESRHPTRLRSDDAATSTAPQIGRKRRLSTQDDERESTPAKKARADSEAPTDEQEQERGSSPAAPTDTEEVKEVTKGVNDVELEEKPAPEASATEEKESAAAEIDAKEGETDEKQAAAVPLPDSPQLKAAEGEDADAEADADADAEGEVDGDAKPVAPQEESAAPVADEEVPGLTLTNAVAEKTDTEPTAAS